MCYLCIKYEVTDYIILADQCCSVFAEVVKYLHDLARLHRLQESMIEWVDGLQIYDEAFVRKIYLYQLHPPIFGEALAVNPQDGRVTTCGLHDSLG